MRLTEVFRQAASSKIIQAAHAINRGLLPNLNNSKDAPSDFYFIEVQDTESCLQKIMMTLDRLHEKFGYSPLKDTQILSPQSRGIVGVRNLNEELQKKLNPINPEKSVSKYGSVFGIGDKVMQIQNNYDKDVFNGDIGFVKSIDDGILTVRFDEQDVDYEFNELDELTLSFATTIHKSQGSEYPVVIIPLMMNHYISLKRNLIYTGITRGKKLVVVIGEKKAFSICVKALDTEKRWTALKLLMQDSFQQKLAN